MDLKYDFYRLPICFDAGKLAEEVAGFTEDEWRDHPSGFAGNTALQLISSQGSLEGDGLAGQQLPTPLLKRCPYLQQVLASFNTVFGRTRLMRLAPGSDAKAHMDASYYWHQRVRVHVPIQTHPDIAFHTGDSAVHMAEGDCWIFNTWKMHTVKNNTEQTRIHLVADTVGSASLWDMIDNAVTIPGAGDDFKEQSPRFISFREGADTAIETEAVNFPVVMTPWEQHVLLSRILDDLHEKDHAKQDLVQRLTETLLRFRRQWHNTWALHGEDASGWPSYENFLQSLQAALQPFVGRLYLSNGMEATGMIEQAVVAPALNPGMASTPKRARVGLATSKPEPTAAPPASDTNRQDKGAQRSVFDRPVIIVAAPRSGSSFLFETLSRSPDVFTVGGESHGIFENIPKLQPANRLFESNRLTSSDADAQTSDIIRQSFSGRVRDRQGQTPKQGQRFRLLEKTPKNALRIPFLNALFPDALFIYLYREPAGNISSIKDAWESERFVTYRDLPGWSRGLWSLLLTPGWRDLESKGLFDIALQQWSASHQHIISDLEDLAPERWAALSYQELVDDTSGSIARLCQFAGLRCDTDLSEPLPLSKHTLTPPAKEKWRRHEAQITPLLKSAGDLAARAEAMVESSKQRKYPEQLRKDPLTDSQHSPLRSSYTANLSAMFEQMKLSLMVTTYQAGKVVIVRSRNKKLNTHFSDFEKPMGLAVRGPKLAVGTKNAVEFFLDVPGKKPTANEQAAPEGRFIKRLEQITGNIDIHELAWSSSEVWLVNTKFSCLCTLDLNNNFVPRWRPWFISALEPEDRCHLNGLCLVDDEPRYVTALGQSDSAGGWRPARASGGIIMDITSNTLVATGLSMPHSPRWYRDQLWVLESGKGALSRVNTSNGQIETVVVLPGFTRGLSFVGDLAFVGLSEVRETAVFGSIPITESASERICGVWVVDIKAAKVVGWLRFEGDVREIFAVEALSGRVSPELIQSHESVLDSTFVTPPGTLA